MDGQVLDRDGLIPDAIRYTDEEIADLLTEVEERQRHIENMESLLKQWIDLRHSRLRQAKCRLQLQKMKKEVSN